MKILCTLTGFGCQECHTSLSFVTIMFSESNQLRVIREAYAKDVSVFHLLSQLEWITSLGCGKCATLMFCSVDCGLVKCVMLAF